MLIVIQQEVLQHSKKVHTVNSAIIMGSDDSLAW